MAFFLWLSSEMAPISKIFNVGFVGVSIQTIFVDGRKDLLICSMSAKSMNVNVILYGSNISLINRYVPPYISSGTITLSPGLRSESIECSAASPEENVKPYLPSSSEARQASRAVRVGFATREYSYPLFLLTSSWVNVDVW